jgi:hypothetical protein
MFFDPTKEVPSFELCKKLKELGFPQEGGGFYWAITDVKSPYKLLFWEETEPYPLIDKIKAPTCRELGEWLPYYIPKLKFLHTERGEDGDFHLYYDERMDNGAYIYIIAETEPNARAKILIWLVENGYVKFEEKEGIL